MSDAMASTAAGYFGPMREEYDSLIRRAVPRYHEMTAALLDYLPEGAARVLELGCGTGNLSLSLAARFPSAAITFVDAAPEMVDLTRARLAEAHPGAVERGTFLVARFEELRPAPGSFDLVTSCISLHHVADKGALYRTVRSALAPGGTFRFADQLWGGTEGNAALNWRRWLEFCRLPGHCAEDEIQGLLDHAREHDHYTPVREHFRLLEDAGFTSVDCVWRSGMWGVITAEAP